MPTIQAQDIVNAAIQDSQVQTTNRTALYDYVDRVHQRILRESQWRFLLSDPQTFVTMPGISQYTLTSGTAPAGSFQTSLELGNFNNIAPGTVFDVTTWAKLEEDSDNSTTLNYIVNRDGSLRTGQPRTYTNSISHPGTINLMPAPDGNNLYYPVPETPVVTSTPTVGCNLPLRRYYGVVTFVDSTGGESTRCVIPFVVSVPTGSILTVQSPNNVPGLESGNQVLYNGWNLYIGYTLNGWTRQNPITLQIGTNWTEPINGILTGSLPVPSTLGLPPNLIQTTLSILSTGQLSTTTPAFYTLPSTWVLQAPNSTLWEVTVNGSGFLITVPWLVSTTGITVLNQVLLTDTSNVSTWAISVNNIGELQSIVFSTPPTTQAINSQPPTTTSINPLNAYVIQFRYYLTRNQIVNPTDVLQIPYAYKDIVIAGVMYLANLYMDRNDGREPAAKTSIYKRDFEQGLSQIRRDLRVSYRKVDFIAPDIASQYVVGNQQGIPTLGW